MARKLRCTIIAKCAYKDSKNEFFDHIKAVFSQKVWSFQEKAVPLYQQNPPRFPKTSEPGRGVFFI
jgi:hypothetical protein